MIKLITFLAMIITLAILFGGICLLIGAPFQWLAIGFMSYCRPRLVLSRAILCFMAIWFVAVLALRQGDGAMIGMLLAIFLAPWPARLWANRDAFRADDEEKRAAAADIRNLKLEAEGSRVRVNAGKPWREYVTDSARADLVSVYQLPATFPR